MQPDISADLPDVFSYVTKGILWFIQMNGKIDDVGKYNRALTDQEVMDIYLENGWTGN